MDKSAIVQIQESANIPQLIEFLEANINHPATILPDSMNLQSLEQYNNNAFRYRANYQTDNIVDFCKYNRAFEQDGSHCFINSEQMSAQTIFDLGTEDAPLHKENKASIKLKKTALFAAITRIDSRQLSQKSAAEFIEDWALDLMAENSMCEKMQPSAAAKALRDLTIEAARELNSKVSDFGESMSSMERIEAKNQNTLPALITFKCAPYSHMQEREFQMRLSILTGHDKPSISMRLIQMEKATEEMTEEFKSIIIKELESTKIKTFIGSI